MKRTVIGILCVAFVFSFAAAVFAVTPGQVEKSNREIEKEKSLRERIEKKLPKPQIEEKQPEEAAPIAPGEKTLVKKITVSAATLVSEKELTAITSQYENKEATLRDIQKIADLITDLYRKKGYVTSRAYLPPQKITDGKLEIRVVEGVTGDIEVKGNKFFKARLFRKRIALKKGEPFNYETLRKGLSRINQEPDRNAKAVITPGKEAGTTDVILDVKDKFPIHAGFDWDNFGSRYIHENRFRTSITDNNLLGLGDIMTFQVQGSEGENYRLLTGRYVLPVNENLDLGFFAADSKIKLQEDLEDANTRGKSRYYSIYATQALINRENMALNLNCGFDYKDIFNFANGAETSRDRVRIAKLGLDWDLTDRFGRTLVIAEINYGIPDFMGGLQKRDAHASRAGSGGKFHKESLNLLRLQKMPFNSQLLWKNQFQFTPYILTGAEQYQIGSIANVRGYPPAEVVGDRGYAMTWEWSFPVYGMSKKIKVPFSEANLYDALRVLAFYDWANTRLIRPQAPEQKDRTLRSAGCGLRFNLPEDFSLRLEFAWALDNMPSDSEGLHILTAVSKSF